MDKRTKQLLIIGAVVLAAYLGYRWYENRQAGGSTGLGTNLNSMPTALVGGSTGPMSGLQYYAGATNVYVTEQVSQSATAPGNKVSSHPMKKGLPVSWQ